MSMVIGIVFVAFLASTVAAWVILGATVSERARARRRLARLAGRPGMRGAPVQDAGDADPIVQPSRSGPHAPPASDDLAEKGGTGLAWRPWDRLVAPLARRLERSGAGGTRAASGRGPGLDLRLQRAGVHLTASEFRAIRILSISGGGLFGFLLAGGLNGAIAGCPAGWLIPAFYLRRRGTARLKALDGQIGDALVMMSNSLKAGYSFLQAMELISAEMAPPLSEEFALTLREMNLGAETEDALQAMAERAGSADLDMVMTAVLIQRQVGGNLAEVLDNISVTIRERVRIRGEIKALTAQGRMSGLVIGLLPVGIFMFLMFANPEYVLSMVQRPLGRFMLGLGATGEILGAVFIRKIIRIEV